MPLIGVTHHDTCPNGPSGDIQVMLGNEMMETYVGGG